MELRRSTTDDLPAIERIWREVGWLTDDDEAAQLPQWLAKSNGWVAELDGAAECAVTIHPGRMMVEDTDLPLAAVTSVTTSRVARRQGLASRLTAMALVDAAEQGAVIAALGMFDQGFYDRLGFGTGTSQLVHRFDPSTLQVDLPTQAPVRVTPDDWAEVHAILATRRRPHGGVIIDADGFSRAEIAWATPWFGLGFRDDTGTLTHALWGSMTGENGPLDVIGLAYRDSRDLFDLVGLLRMVGDQVRLVKLPEPAGLVVRDLLDRPDRSRFLTLGADNPVEARGVSWWQARVLDVAACVAARSWSGPPVACNVTLVDPLARHPDVSWTQVDGDWVVEVSAASTATRGHDPALPTLEAGVGAFTRLLLGVAPATSLALTDRLDGPAELLVALDRALRSPPPHPGLGF